MGKYWLKIGLGASLIFVVGFAILSAGRSVRHKVHSSQDLTIPLGALGAYPVPFKLDGTRLGALRSLVIKRASPKEITGFVIRARVSDSSLFSRFRECRVSVEDAANLDERTTFTCLPSDSGHQVFGELRVEFRSEDGTYTVVQPLLLADADVREFQRHAADSVASPMADSMAERVAEQVKSKARLYQDSVRAESLEQRAKQYQRRADSIRNKAAPTPPTAVVKP